MSNISLWNLSLAFIPVALLLLVMIAWSINYKNTLYAMVRMVTQLLLIGFLLNSIFSSNSYWLTITLLCIMLLAASWIALNSLPVKNSELFKITFISIMSSGVFTLAIMTQAVLEVTPWYNAQIIIPIAGMIFANNMNSVSLAGERFYAELKNTSLIDARNKAFQAALIPITNSLFAVGLVSLPGMMTGQILSGVEPLIAVRYQIMVMCMILGAGGLSTGLFLHYLIRHETKDK
ncbi:MAG: ABC transporter permease [Gammaproteobacteria bacterium]|nr:ABC transporter permease [Gammaproteobacteria bacterium]